MVCDEAMEDVTVVSSTADLGPARRVVMEAASRALDDTAALDVALVVSELVTNALEHGSGGDVSVAYGTIANGFGLCVTSASSGVPVSSEQPVPNDRTHGRGLLIVASLADDVAVTGSAGAVAVRCTFLAR